MRNASLDRNITEILNNRYTVPLYQRNFAWKEDEINQLLQDIHESFELNKHKNPKGNYYIGSLVVIKRKNGDYEVIDGQQRLTAITLISKILNDDLKEPKLFYDSRPEVEAFFHSFYQTGNTNDITFDYKVSHLINAVDYIKESKLNVNNNNDITIKNFGDDIECFKQFFFHNVILVFVELPQDTDVANYFEIMNNRGQQLQKHEIIKAKLLDKLKNINGEHDQAKQKIYSKIWNACSQMNTHIQKLFLVEDRKCLFGEDYDKFPTINKIQQLVLNLDGENNVENRNLHTIDSIIKGNVDQQANSKNSESNDEIDIDDEGDDKPIIDFPNFLMHILKLKYESEDTEIRLNEKYLIDDYSKVLNKIDVEDFISSLLYYRTIFDRYVVKATTNENSEDQFEWTLKIPYRYYYEQRNANVLKYKQSFKNSQDRIIKALSMLQVTFRQRIYKNYLQEILSWFPYKNEQCEIDSCRYIEKLDEYIANYFLSLKLDINPNQPYSAGTGTPRFLFNFIDYLYWVESNNDKSKPQFKFDFRYRNSIEHHRPQSRKDSVDDILINSLGNLCLVSKSSNSKMNNEEPVGKAKAYYNNGNLTPKRKIMYDMSYDIKNDKGKSWGKLEIEQHCKEVTALINNQERIIGKININ